MAVKRIFYRSNAHYFYQFSFCRNQCRISGNLSGIGRRHRVACDFAAQTACNYITVGRHFLYFRPKRTGGSFADLVGVPVYEAQRTVILEIAEKESCVIIGRNADFILKDKDNVLNIFIHGDMPEKVARICKLYNVTEEEAEKMMADIDKRRMTNYRFYTDQKWGMAKNYILSLNSSVLGYDLCEKIIMDCKK